MEVGNCHHQRMHIQAPRSVRTRSVTWYEEPWTGNYGPARGSAIVPEAPIAMEYVYGRRP